MNLLKTLVVKTLRVREESSSNFDPLCSYVDSPSPATKLHYSYPLRSATLNRLESENEEQFWSFPRKSEPVLEYDYISSKNSHVTCRNDQVESNIQSKQEQQQHKEVVNIEGILERLNLRKGVRKLCRYPVFPLSKPAKKAGTVIAAQDITSIDHVYRLSNLENI